MFCLVVSMLVSISLLLILRVHLSLALFLFVRYFMNIYNQGSIYYRFALFLFFYIHITISPPFITPPFTTTSLQDRARLEHLYNIIDYSALTVEDDELFNVPYRNGRKLMGECMCVSISIYVSAFECL